jgi:Kef-type K+ transport system membrane component KefB/nucleotide-binding universal stress UspA family protein
MQSIGVPFFHIFVYLFPLPMTILSIAYDLSLPLTNPVLKFFIILVIILLAPIIFNRIKIPYLLGLIIAGAVIGPNGFNLIVRDSSIILSGTAGLLYIMFLAGLEIELADFKRNSGKSTVLGLYGFMIPMILGTSIGFFFLKLSPIASILLASMFASHTLITYPIVSKLGIIKNRAVNITVGSTLITNTLALLVLAVVVGITSGKNSASDWFKLSVSLTIFSLIVTFIFPLIGRWFLKRFEDSVSQYIFVLAMVFFGAALAQIAGIEAIIGAFMAGLAFNRLVPRTSPLMNRIGFVGNAIFIPFFLIGVGMLIDYKAFFTDLDTFKVAVTMSVVATAGKFIAAWITQKNYRFSADERRIIFGLSNSQAAATLAAVLIGYNIILGYTETAEPIRLLNDAILNGTIVMILFTCTIASFVTQKGATNIALLDNSGNNYHLSDQTERILIPMSNPDTAEELVNLSLIIKSKHNRSGLYALSILDHSSNDQYEETAAGRTLERAVSTAAAADAFLKKMIRYDSDKVNGIAGVVKEKQITDLILGLHEKKGFSDTFLGNLTEGILTKCNTTTIVYKRTQPVATIKRHLIFIPENAEKESGFPFWLVKLWNIAANTGAIPHFYGTTRTLHLINQVHLKHPIDAEMHEFYSWDEFISLSKVAQPDDNLIIIMSRKNRSSYHPVMEKIPDYLNKYFTNNSFILIYPIQSGVAETDEIDFGNPSLLKPIEKLDEIGKTLSQVFRKKHEIPE